MNTDLIQNMMSCSLIIHNMCVSDRVMEGDVRARYNPMNSEPRRVPKVTHPSDYRPLPADEEPTVIGIAGALPSVQVYVTRQERWVELKGLEHHQELGAAIMEDLWLK